MKNITSIVIIGLSFALPATAQPVLGPLFEEDVTKTQTDGEMFFGSGNANGSWTMYRGNDNGVELALRAKVRFDENGQPLNEFPNNGSGTYQFGAGDYLGNGLALWNFEFAIDTDWNGNGGNLGDFTYTLFLDRDPLAAINFAEISFPLVSGPVNNTVSQGSQNYGFSWLADAPYNLNFDPNATGSYIIGLGAYDVNGDQVGFTQMEVSVVPEPRVVGLAALAGMAGLLWVRRRLQANRP